MHNIPLHILLVDDDEFFSNVVGKVLREEYQYRTTIVHDGSEAQQLLSDNSLHFDMILSDYDMPIMNGLELLKWIQAQNIEIPVVMLTAAGSEMVAVDAMKYGAYDYVRKENLDLQHLGIVVASTHERRQYRAARSIEEEQSRETDLNLQATDKVRDLLNSLSPKINAALAGIHNELDSQGVEIFRPLPMMQQREFKQCLERLKKETGIIESSILIILQLYRLLYAHHTGAAELERLKQEIEQMS